MTRRKRVGPKWEPSYELLKAILARLAQYYPECISDPEAALADLMGEDRYDFLTHMGYLEGHGLLLTNIVYLPGSTRLNSLDRERMAWAPKLLKKGLSAHLGIEPIPW